MIRLFKPKTQRWLSSFLIVTLTIGLLPAFFVAEKPEIAQAIDATLGVELAQAQSSQNTAQDTYGIVAVLVDKALINSSENYDGLADSYPATPSSSLEKRVKRYAQDIQNNLPYTKALVIEVDAQEETVFDIASTLERLYFDGDGSEDEQNMLVGAVFVGDLPLPVVNKNGNSFISMLPYTDFDEKSYIFNPETGVYEKDSRVNFPRVEIWHGVIKGSNEDMASYFDKNHLYHVGHKDFTEFDKSILLSDLYHEQKLKNDDFFKFYDRYTQFSEDLAYFRFNKHWAEELYSEFVGDVSNESGSVMKPEFKAFLENTLKNGLFANLPDIMAKQAVLEKYHMPYVKLFTRYLSLNNDWVDYSGRYTRDDAQSVVELISTKDLYTQEYLKQVNSLLEQRTENMVQKALQKHIPLVSHTALSGNIIVEVKKEVEDGPDDDNLPDIIIEEEKLPFVNTVKSVEEPIAGSDFNEYNLDVPLFGFLNSSLILEAAAQHPTPLIKAESFTPEPIVDELTGKVETFPAEISASFEIENAADKLYINGLSAEDISSVLDCSIYRGSSQITSNNRLYNASKAGESMFLGVYTKPFFDYADYEYGLLVTKDPLIALPAVVKGSPAEKAGIKEGDILLSINDNQLNNEFADRLMLDDVLGKMKANQNPVKVKYYSIAEKKEITKMINLEGSNAPKWAAGCQGTNGIEIDGNDNAGKCFAPAAKLPLFDLAAGKEISVADLHSGEDIDTAHIRSCYDFYYDEGPQYSDADFGSSVQVFTKLINDFDAFNSDLKNYLNPNVKFDASVERDAASIILYDDKGFKLTFADLLKHAGAFDGIDNDADGEVDEEDESNEQYAASNEDWAEIGQRVLSQNGSFKFFVPKISTNVELKIEANVVKWISSMIPHQEPLNSTIGAQFRAKATEALPIDSVRYVSFLDKNGVLKKLEYPNAFKANSYQDLQIKIYKLAKEISKMPGADKLLKDGELSEDEIANDIYLQFIEGISGDEEIYKKTETAHNYLAKTSDEKLGDAILWNKLGIDDKHSYVLKSYLNPDKDAFSEEKNGYEALYFVADGDSDYSTFSFHGDYPALEFDESFATLEAELTSGEDYVGIETGSEGSYATNENGEVYNEIGTEKDLEAVPLWEWFPEMATWLEESLTSVTAIANVDFLNNPSCAIDQSFNIYSVATANDEEGDGPIDSFGVFLEKSLLQADAADSTTLVLKALNADGEFIASENVTRVKLIIKPDNQEVLTVNVPETAFVNGIASFSFNSTLNAGTVVVQADAVNTKKRILSKAITITSTKRNIQILSQLSGQSSDEVVAGSEEPMVLKAVLFDENEEVAVNDNSSRVSFTLIDANENASLAREIVTAKEGVAETQLNIKKKAGLVKIKAEILNSNFPISERDIFVVPGPLDDISVKPQSNIIKAGGLSYSPVKVELKDKFGNIKNNEPSEVTLWHEGPGEFKNVQDRDLERDGIQVYVPEGVVSFDMSSKEESGNIKVHAEVESAEESRAAGPPLTVRRGGWPAIERINGFATIESRYDIFLEGFSNKSELKADGQSESLISVSVRDGSGILDRANLPLNFSISQNNLAEFTSQPPKQFKDAQAKLSVKSKTTSGDFSVLVSSPGFDSIAVPIEVKPLEPYSLRFLPVEGELLADESSTLKLEAEILDVHGNFVADESEIEVDFAISDSTSHVAQFLGSSSLVAQNGKVSPTLKATQYSGPVRIVAGSKALADGDSLELFSQKRLYSSSLKESNPKVLFASLLGNAFGDVSDDNNLGSSILFAGTTQAVSASTTSMQQAKSLFAVDAAGLPKLFDNANVEARYLPSSKDAVSDRVSFSDIRTDALLGEVAIVLSDEASVELENLTEIDDYIVKQTNGSSTLFYKQTPHINFTNEGQIKILEGNYDIEPVLSDVKNLTFVVRRAGQLIVHFVIKPEVDKDVMLIKPSDEMSDDGVYLIKHETGREYAFLPFFSGNSTLAPQGYAFKDLNEAATADQLIGGPFASLESAYDNAGVGFTSQNKHMLLFFAGNSVGDSAKAYASESGIVFGDPTVRIDSGFDGNVPLYDQGSGFTSDLGQSIYTDNQNIQSMVTFDYNSDSIDDLLIAFEDGKVRLLEGLQSSQANPFRDKGYLLDVVNGIYDLDVGDVNNDGQVDIVVATKESCHVGESCIYVYENNNGFFAHKNAELNLSEKVSDLEVVDLNKDGADDLLVADLNRAIYAFYGSEKGLEIQGQKVGGLMPEANEGVNSAHQTFIAYNRSASEKAVIANGSPYDPSIQMILPSNSSANFDYTNSVAGLVDFNSENVKVSAAQAKGKKLYEFLPLNKDLRVGKSFKKVEDENGDKIKGGDVLNYTIDIVNSGDNIFNASILDYLPDGFEFDYSTISCDGCDVAPQVLETGMLSRPYLITGLNIASGEVLKLSYSVKTSNFPPLKLVLGTSLDDYEKDEYLDIAAFAQDTPQNRVIYASKEKDAKTGYMHFQEFFPAQSLANLGASKPQIPDTSPGENAPVPAADNNGNGMPDSHEGIDEDTSQAYINSLLPNDEAISDIEDYFRSGQKDRDLDGLPDELDIVNGTLDDVGDRIEAVIGALKCSGGCVPIPINMTLNIPFPVPGKVNLFGIPGPYIPGIPLFSINKPNTLAPPVINTPVWPGGNPFYFESLFRIYSSPTLTGGLGTAMCLGDYAWTEGNKANSCFIFAVPVLQVLGVCKALTEGVTGALDSLVNGSESAKSGLQTVIATGSNPQTTSNAVSGSGFTSGPYPISASGSANVRIPGFPAVITNWLDRQTEEIIDALIDLPDIYLVLPDPRSLVGEELKQDFNVSNMHEFLGYLNSIPLIQIEQKEVKIKIPWLYADQIAKLEREYTQWLENLKADYERFKKTFNCDLDTYNSVCNKIAADVSQLTTTMERNLQLLDDYRKLPKQLITLRNLEAQYIRQLVCYLDTIIDFTASYTERQGDRIDAWLKAVDDVKNIVKNWKILVDVSIAYAESCDSCKNDKFSLLEIMTRLFVVVPDPPIIELPRLPDITIDVSQIQTGLKLTLPDFVFVPEPIIMPSPPRFQFPDVVLPEVKVVLPPVPTLPRLPEVPRFLPKLPNLPPLPLPKLPDLPPPPKIPQLPSFAYDLALSLESIFRIMCLIKGSLIPFDEPSVSTQFETLTQRGLSPLLPAPFDLGLSFELPPASYTYVEEIELIAKLNLQLDMDLIYQFVKTGADVANAYSEFGIDYLNKKLEEGEKLVDVTVIDPSKLNLPINNLNIDLGNNATGEKGADAIHEALSSSLYDEARNFEENLLAYKDEVDQINKYSRSLPNELKITGSSTMIDPSHPIFNHSIEDIKLRIDERKEINAPTQMVAMRNQLIAYYDHLESGRAGLESVETNGEFMRFLVQNDKSPLIADSSYKASGVKNYGLSLGNEVPTKKSNDNAWAKNEGEKIKKRLIALTDDEGEKANPHDGSSPKGVFVYNEEQGVNHALISYTEEIGSVSHIAYLDVDQDDDEDILLSFAGDIYLKRNWKKSGNENFYQGTASILKLKDLKPSAEAINYLRPTYTGNEQVKIAWDEAKQDNFKAYELDVKYRFDDFNDDNSSGSTAHFVADDSENQDVIRPAYYQQSIVDGSVLTNGKATQSEQLIEIGDLLQMSEDLNAELHLDAFDKSDEFLGRIKLGSSTNWLIESIAQDAHVFNIQNGEVIFDLSETASPFLKAGDTIVTGDANVLVDFGNDRSYLIRENQEFVIPKSDFVEMYAADTGIFSDISINTFERFVTSTATGKLEEGTLLHMLEDSTIKVVASNENKTLFKLSQKAHTLFAVPAGLPLDTLFSIDGEVEIIKTKGPISWQEFSEGMAILPKDFVYVSDGQANLRYTNSSASVDLRSEQSFALYNFSNIDEPEATVELSNGNYYGVMRTVLNDNSRGSSSMPAILAPQSCGDKGAPYINVGELEKSIPIFSSAQVDASGSFDSAGKVVGYYADINLTNDSDGDGDATNDKNLFADLNQLFDTNNDGDTENDMDSSNFTFGPYKEPGQHKVKIYAIDQSGNASGQIVTINVFVPEIFLDSASAHAGILSGHIEPRLSDIPIGFIRDREGIFTPFSTKSANENSKYKTGLNGEFEVADLAITNAINVKNARGDVIAEIDPVTGNITINDDSYKVELRSARPPHFPTRAVITDTRGRIMSSFFIVPDLNSDTQLVNEFNSKNKAVQIKISDNIDDFEFNTLPGNDPNNPGATQITYKPENKPVVLINTSGNIFKFDERVTLELFDAEAKTYDIHFIRLFFEQQEIAVIYLASNSQNGEIKPIPERDLYKIDAVGSSPVASSVNKSGDFKIPFEDVDPDASYANAIRDLAQKGIIDGYNEDGKLLYKPDQLISRAEYTKILLKTMCIEPRAEAYEAPSVFSDIPFDENNIPWFYPFVKESNLQNFIQGYLGEKDEVTGLAPFKPGLTIIRIEAAVIILSALEKLNVLSLDGVEPGNPWYAPYSDVAVNLSSYLIDPKADAQIFLLTSSEASDPTKAISRAEFAVMAQRVLGAYNCFGIDDDEDGMPSQWEKDNNLDPFDAADAKEDPDKDTLKNLDEYLNDTDPFNPDTDGGCMMDGPEVYAGFNPAYNPDDDDPDFDGLSCNDEINIYKTNPKVADTDSGGVNDGTEVLEDKTDPLNGDDDQKGSGGYGDSDSDFDDFKSDLPEGVYAIEESCNVCPCPASLDEKADIMEGDNFWGVITAEDDNSKIYRKSNSVTITNVP